MNITIERHSTTAQDLAGKAILLEIGAEIGILHIIENSESISVDELTQQLPINKEFSSEYLAVLERLNLLTKSTKNGVAYYAKSNEYDKEINKIGYISWGMVSCAPLITHAKEFISDFQTAVQTHCRDGEHVARTSKWMGARDFYPHAERVILNLKPKKVVDLGSGTCGLLISLTRKIPALKSIGVDLSKHACDVAKKYIKELNLQNQITVVESPIQSLVDDNAFFVDADVIHAGFVFHDLLPDEEETLDNLLHHIHSTAPQATLVIVDAIPFLHNEDERGFSNAFSFLHKFFMGRKLLPEDEWIAKLKKAGFTKINIEKLGISGGRIFSASHF